MKTNKGKFYVFTSNNVIEITGIYKRIILSISFYLVFILLASISLSSILEYYTKKKIKNEINVLKEQKELTYSLCNKMQIDILKPVVEAVPLFRDPKDKERFLIVVSAQPPF